MSGQTTPRVVEADPNPERCGARTRSGGVCGSWPVQGATRCRMHGGAAPQVKAAAKRRLAQDSVRRSLEQVEVREIDNPIAELQRLTAEVVAFKDALASHVASLEDRYRFTDDKGAEQLDARVALYERALDRAGKFLEMWARLGLDAMLAEMKVRVTEAQVAAMTRGLDAYRKAAEVGGEAHGKGMEAMAREMRR